MPDKDRAQPDAEGKLRRGERVSVQIPAEVADAIIEEAHQQRRKVSQMIRVILEEWVEMRRRHVK